MGRLKICPNEHPYLKFYGVPPLGPTANESLPYWFQGNFAAPFVFNFCLREFLLSAFANRFELRCEPKRLMLMYYKICPCYPKEDQNYLSQILLASFSEEFLKFLRILLQGHPFFPGLLSRRLKNNFLIFTECVKQSSPYVRRLLLKNFLAEMKIFWEPGSQVRYFLQLSTCARFHPENTICYLKCLCYFSFNIHKDISCFQDSDSDWDSLSGGGPDIEPPSISNAQESARQMKHTPAPPMAEKIPSTQEKGPPRAAEQYRNTTNRGSFHIHFKDFRGVGDNEPAERSRNQVYFTFKVEPTPVFKTTNENPMTKMKILKNCCYKSESLISSEKVRSLDPYLVIFEAWNLSVWVARTRHIGLHMDIPPPPSGVTV